MTSINKMANCYQKPCSYTPGGPDVLNDVFRRSSGQYLQQLFRCPPKTI